MQQLSTGKRINSSIDDAAGLAIAARMTENIKGLDQAIRNAGDGIALIQVAEGATNEITNMLQRMSELAVQSSNATISIAQRGFLNEEFQQLKQEIIRIADSHEWNGFPILKGKFSSEENRQFQSEELMPAIKWSTRSITQTESAQVEFKPLNPGQSVTVAGPAKVTPAVQNNPTQTDRQNGQLSSSPSLLFHISVRARRGAISKE